MILNKSKKQYTGQNIKVIDGVKIAPGIFVYDNIIDNSEELINFALLDKDRWRDSRISSANGLDGVINKEIRNTRIFDAPSVYSNDIKWFEISQIIWNYADRYGLENDAAFSGMEYLQLLHYSTEEGFYKPHADSGPGMQRIFSAILYLNDVEEGGETYFNNFDIAVRPKSGRLVIFPANFVYKHEARTPKSNDKFALVTWFSPVM